MKKLHFKIYMYGQKDEGMNLNKHKHTKVMRNGRCSHSVRLSN